MTTKDEALRMAVEARTWDKLGKAIQACKEALADYKDGDCCTEGCIKCDARKVLAETQEPVAWMNDKSPNGIFARHKEGADNFGCDIPLYTTPPSREWVGLSDDEITSLEYDHVSYETFDEGEYGTEINIYTKEFARAIEAKLREKNEK